MGGGGGEGVTVAIGWCLLSSVSLPNLVCSICRVTRKEMIPIPMGDDFGVKCEKLMFSLKILLLPGMDQTD